MFTCLSSFSEQYDHSIVKINKYLLPNNLLRTSISDIHGCVLTRVRPPASAGILISDGNSITKYFFFQRQLWGYPNHDIGFGPIYPNHGDGHGHPNHDIGPVSIHPNHGVGPGHPHISTCHCFKPWLCES